MMSLLDFAFVIVVWLCIFFVSLRLATDSTSEMVAKGDEKNEQGQEKFETLHKLHELKDHIKGKIIRRIIESKVNSVTEEMLNATEEMLNKYSELSTSDPDILDGEFQTKMKKQREVLVEKYNKEVIDQVPEWEDLVENYHKEIIDQVLKYCSLCRNSASVIMYIETETFLYSLYGKLRGHTNWFALVYFVLEFWNTESISCVRGAVAVSLETAFTLFLLLHAFVSTTTELAEVKWGIRREHLLYAQKLSCWPQVTTTSMAKMGAVLIGTVALILKFAGHPGFMTIARWQRACFTVHRTNWLFAGHLFLF